MGHALQRLGQRVAPTTLSPTDASTPPSRAAPTPTDSYTHTAEISGYARQPLVDLPEM